MIRARRHIAQSMRRRRKMGNHVPAKGSTRAQGLRLWCNRAMFDGNGWRAGGWRNWI